MRVTVILSDDVSTAVEQTRIAEGIGVSEAVNRLVRRGLDNPLASPRHVHNSYDMGMRIDVSNVGEVIGTLDELDPPC